MQKKGHHPCMSCVSRHIVDVTVKEFGRIDILVNNASMQVGCMIQFSFLLDSLASQVFTFCW